jgi:hypothetical protein
MPWWYAVVESRHERGGPAVLLASKLGCPITLVELSAEFRERSRRQRERYLRWTRGLLGWAIFVARVQ